MDCKLSFAMKRTPNNSVLSSRDRETEAKRERKVGREYSLHTCMLMRGRQILTKSPHVSLCYFNKHLIERK